MTNDSELDETAPSRGDFRLYLGAGTPLSARGRVLPLSDFGENQNRPEGYRADERLVAAVNVALTLQQPLLLTGEPGTGKTELASSIAYELELGDPLVFQAKTTSSAVDLFYRYDAVRHFHDAHFHEQLGTANRYISFEALGLAILLSNPPEAVESQLPDRLRAKSPRRAVVLVDEIDKAPRDFPNDLLRELEQMAFSIPETGQRFVADRKYRPIVIITSNSEKSLPDAFLRRCVYHHINFPTPDRLRHIVESRIAPTSAFTPKMVEHAITHFFEIRDLSLRKKPATAECLAWIELLKQLQLDVGSIGPGDVDTLVLSYAVLAKTQEDLADLIGRAEMSSERP